MIEPNGRNLVPPEPLGSKKPPVAGDYIAFGVDQQRDIETEGLNALGNLTDLLGAVLAGLPGSGLN